MIGWLAGIVQEKNESNFVLQTASGVGYEVYPTANLDQRAQSKASLSFPVATHMREAEITLYGFVDSAEKKLFSKLIMVNGVGPKMSLNIISTLGNRLMNAVNDGDISTITEVSGVGKKMAQKIIIELQGKIDLASEASLPSAAEEAMSTLQSLGYDKRVIAKEIKALAELHTAEEIIKAFLQTQN